MLAPRFFRPADGAHATAFAASGVRGVHELTMPYEQAANLARQSSPESERQMQARVRHLAGLRLWQEAFDRRALTRDMRKLRWEYVGCAALAPGEAVLQLFYNYSSLEEGGTLPWPSASV